MNAHYDIGKFGRDIYESLVSHSPDALRTTRLFRELVTACYGRFLSTRSDIGPIDANYGDLNVFDGEIVDFAEWTDENKNIDLAKYLLERLRAIRPNTERDGVRFYCDYLDKALAVT